MTTPTLRLQSASSQIGVNSPSPNAPGTAQSQTTADAVIYYEFAPAPPAPTKKARSLRSVIDHFESDPVRANLLTEARKAILPAAYPGEVDSLRALRMLAGMSQAQLAAKSQTAQSHIAMIELGKTDPSTDTVARIANALGCQPEAVFRGVRFHRDSRKGQDHG